jgi:membrane protein
VVFLLVTGVNTAFRHQTLVTMLLEQRLIGDAMVLLFACLPYFALWLIFALFYAFLPNTRVRFVPALIGGLIGGTLWQGAQWVYIEFQIGVAGYAAIYGALAQLPLLIAWIYTSWVITLLGAEVTFACQHIAQVPLAWRTHLISIYRQEWLVSALYLAVVETFRAGTTPWSATAFAQQQQVPLSLVRELVIPLCAAHLLVEVTATPDHYVPGRDPATITPWHVLHTLRHHSDAGVEEPLPPGRTLATTLMMHIEDAIQKVAGAQTMTQWLTEDYTSAESDTSEGRNAP